MATVVRKGAGRPAAKERSNRHAQRTPLPPRPGQVEAAREEIDSAADPETLTPTEYAAAEADAKSLGKAQGFTEKAVALGWSASTAPVAGAVEVTATRGAEVIVQAWRNGVWDYSVSFYGFGDRTTKPRNASGALKLLAREASAASAEASKVASNRHFRKAEPKDLVTRMEDARKVLPFDPENDADEIIIANLVGRGIVWYNRLSRGQESAVVGRSGVRLTRLPDGQRVANFCCPASGYRSCLVTSILKVGRGQRSTTKGAEHETVEVS